MTQKEKIEKDYIVAFKAKDKISKSLLSVIKGEIQNTEKNVGQTSLSDNEVNKILAKVMKNLKETIAQSNDEESKSQLLIVESYLPTQMSREEIEQLVGGLMVTGVKNIGLIMKEFTNLPADRKIVSEVIKEMMK